MLAGTYAEPIDVHPDRYGAAKTRGPDLWLVLHTSEGPEHAESAEQLAAYLERPGDRDNGRGGVYGSSYHAIFDTHRIIPAVPDRTVAYAAGGGNARGIHGCFPGRASQTRAQWLDAATRPMIRQAAAWLVDRSRLHGIPLHPLIPSLVRAGARGMCDHHDISQAFGKSTHTDLGADFPWDVLADDIAAITDPDTDPEEPAMQPAIRALYVPTKTLTDAGMNKVFGLLPDGSVRHVAGPDVEYARDMQAPEYWVKGTEHYRQCEELHDVWAARR